MLQEKTEMKTFVLIPEIMEIRSSSYSNLQKLGVGNWA
jgi:hypothetical protein